MKIDRVDLKWFLDNITRTAERDGKELTNEYLANELGNYIETNPGCIKMDEVSHPGRYSYSTVGYGVFSLLGERYRMGRVEIFDKQNDSGYAVDEGSYCMPFVAASQFEDFIESLQTDLPINIEIGSHKWCQQAVSEELGIPVDKLNDAETKRAFYQKKNDIYAQEQGFKDWDDYLASTEIGRSLLESRNEEMKDWDNTLLDGLENE
jgi:hypothetical protein